MTRVELQVFLTIVAVVAIGQTAIAAVRLDGATGVSIAIVAGVICIVAAALGPDRTGRNQERNRDRPR